MALFVALSSGLTVGLARVRRRREQLDAQTRDWIQYLKDDLAASNI